MVKSSRMQDYMQTVLGRLEYEHYDIKSNITYKGQVFDYVAKRLMFEISKPAFFHKYFIFSKFHSLDTDILRTYSTKSLNFAIKTSPISLVRGLLCGIVCYSIAIVDTLDTSITERIRSKAPPYHWFAYEMPVVYSLESDELYYCGRGPWWGGLYYDEMRFTINYMLAP